jgi:indole-3-glycerol phosphate synthase
MKVTRTILDQILVDVRKELAKAQAARPVAELRRMLADAPPVRSLKQALAGEFGLIAEIKEKSPSHGPMRRENVDASPAAYQRSPIVRAISVLTNHSHFGMNMEHLRKVKASGTKPVLRKDFIFDEYQVYEARAFGADAVLLMANLLEVEEMARLYPIAKELQMDALFECHTREQIEQLPGGAEIYGVNSRTFDARKNVLGLGTYGVSALLGRLGSKKDLSVDLGRFELGQYVPPNAIKVAESGVSPETVVKVRDELGYHAALVGTSLLSAAHGVERELALFEQALSKERYVANPAR